MNSRYRPFSLDRAYPARHKESFRNGATAKKRQKFTTLKSGKKNREE
jgi:hypothetical protein